MDMEGCVLVCDVVGQDGTGLRVMSDGYKTLRVVPRLEAGSVELGRLATLSLIGVLQVAVQTLTE